MEHTALAKLPGELRNTIWRHILIEPEAVVVIQKSIRVFPIFGTCRQIREECQGIYFGENDFVLLTDTLNLELYPYKQWFDRIGRRAASLIGTLLLQHKRDWTRKGFGEGYEQSLHYIKTQRQRETRALTDIIIYFLQTMRVHPSAIQVSEPARREIWDDAVWAVMKEILESDLAEVLADGRTATARKVGKDSGLGA